jgi:hypothetical protein
MNDDERRRVDDVIRRLQGELWYLDITYANSDDDNLCYFMYDVNGHGFHVSRNGTMRLPSQKDYRAHNAANYRRINPPCFDV